MLSPRQRDPERSPELHHFEAARVSLIPVVVVPAGEAGHALDGWSVALLGLAVLGFALLAFAILYARHLDREVKRELARQRPTLRPVYAEWLRTIDAYSKDQISQTEAMRRMARLSSVDTTDAAALALLMVDLRRPDLQVNEARKPAPAPEPRLRFSDERPACPGPDCSACNGSACWKCGAGCVPRHGEPPCEHDTIERHERGVV